MTDAALTLPTRLAARVRDGNERFAVTGATGWFGTVAMHLLADTLGPSLGDRVDAYASRGRRVELETGHVVDVEPLGRLADRAPAAQPTFLLHFAFPARASLADHTDGHAAVTRLVTDAIRGGVAAVAYTSSGKAAAPDDLYGRTKRDDERALGDACRSAGARLVVARVFAASGPFLPRASGYLLGDLVDRARAGEPLVVRAPGEVYRSYVAVTDVVALMLAVLLRGDEQETVFETGGQPVEAGELADHVRDALGCDALEIRREHEATASVDHYVGDDEAFRALAERFGVTPTPLDEQIRRTRLR